MNSPRLAALAVLAAVLVLPLLSSGCSEAWKDRMAHEAEQRKRTLAEKVLKDRALEYWELVRWGSWAQASTYLEKEKDQLGFLRDTTGADTIHTPIDDVELRYVFIGTENPDDAEIRISWTEVIATEARVGEQQVTQRWYKHNGRWWVDPGEPMGVPEEASDEEPPSDLPTETPR
jgi:hypothetical protein